MSAELRKCQYSWMACSWMSQKRSLRKFWESSSSQTWNGLSNVKRYSSCWKVGFQGILGLDKRKVVAQSISQSVLNYCISVWAGTAKRDIESLRVIQNRAAHFVLNLCHRRTNRSGMLTQLRWIDASTNCGLQNYCCLQNKENYLTNENIRGNIIIPHTTGPSLLQRSFVFNGAELGNKIPNDLIQVDCQKTSAMHRR